MVVEKNKKTGLLADPFYEENCLIKSLRFLA